MQKNIFAAILKLSSKINADALGIAASVGCAIHCAFLPVIFTSLPVFGINIIENRSFEIFMMVLAFSIGAYSLINGRRKHHQSNIPVLIFTLGFVFLVLKLFFPYYENWLLVPAVGGIIFAHILNFRSCKIHNHSPSKTYNS